MATKKIRARYTGDKAVTYRWLGSVAGGPVVLAQKFGRVVEDTWSSDVDPRVTRATTVEVDVPEQGLLLIDAQSATAHGSRTYTAGIFLAGSPIDWKRAQWIETVERGEKHAKRLVHIVLVDGVRRECEVQP